MKNKETAPSRCSLKRKKEGWNKKASQTRWKVLTITDITRYNIEWKKHSNRDFILIVRLSFLSDHDSSFLE